MSKLVEENYAINIRPVLKISQRNIFSVYTYFITHCKYDCILLKSEKSFSSKVSFLQSVKCWPAFSLLSPCHHISGCDMSSRLCDMTCDMFDMWWIISTTRRQLLFRQFRDMARLPVYCLHTKISFKQTNKQTSQRGISYFYHNVLLKSKPKLYWAYLDYSCL